MKSSYRKTSLAERIALFGARYQCHTSFGEGETSFYFERCGSGSDAHITSFKIDAALRRCVILWLPPRDDQETDPKDMLREATAQRMKVVPPFERMWVEYTHIDLKYPVDVGVFIHAQPPDKDGTRRAQALAYSTNRGRCPQLVGCLLINIDAEGVCKSIVPDLEFEDKVLPQEALPLFHSHACAHVLRSMHLLHCKNIAMVDEDFDNKANHRMAKAFGKRDGGYKFKTLVVKPSGGGALRPMGFSKQFGVMPLHTVRGHFAVYTNERPLFGKYTGTYFKPAHVRGQSSNGVVDKDYAIASA